ncbi:hypothetical protein [Streptomyces sp. NPDC007369]|uniref:hypothetical protein n=1 Tax=Streptomyces sp. NPDC007369 TaxID=3154589 RepID=UPI00340FF313
MQSPPPGEKRPGPRSGSEPKLKEPLPRYVTTAFVYGSGLGPAQAVRHMRGSVSVHELGAIARCHFTIPVSPGAVPMS